MIHHSNWFGKALTFVAIFSTFLTVLGGHSRAGSLRNGNVGSQAPASGPGNVHWTYFDTFGPGGGGDNILTLINPNRSANPDLINVAPDVCAMIYVFDDDQEMGECCGCPISPAGIETFSVEHDLTANWEISSGAGGIDNGAGSIAIVATAANVGYVPNDATSNGKFCPNAQSAACFAGCDPTSNPGYDVGFPNDNLLGGITHNQQITSNSRTFHSLKGLTQIPLFDNGSGDPNSISYLQAQCGALVGNGSSSGVCHCPVLPPMPPVTSAPTLTPTATATVNQSIYVVAGGSFDGAIFEYPIAASGNATPSVTIEGSKTGLYEPLGVTVDSNGNIYVVNESAPSGDGPGSVTVYPAGSIGNQPPTSNIVGSNTRLNFPTGIALDTSRNMYVTNTIKSSVTVYPSGSSGDVVPSAEIAGQNPGFFNPWGIALDSSGKIYVANQVSITVYPPGSSGDVAPIATIAGDKTGLFDPIRIALDSKGNIYVANFGNDSGNYSITVFPPGSNGNVTPIATIAGPNTGLFFPIGIALDSNGLIYVANETSGTSCCDPATITVYPPLASLASQPNYPNVTPSASIILPFRGALGMAIGP